MDTHEWPEIMLIKDNFIVFKIARKSAMITTIVVDILCSLFPHS